ncbi:CGNR zinc finger domain-containing protein [Georgenia subflava]|uniref:Zinc finger CGNR domain-containing protein n=1 Tax=Georgenia subflava TaxID=1622177 RepID=A0A6N7EDH8_9MICO|nr:CGNR zinc finger domain-containing protein [Georgenia subflava]MPV36159.1 hypothetical protein [Georgenia subflava]
MGLMIGVPGLEMVQVVDVVNHYARAARAAAGDEDKGYAELPAVLGERAGEVPSMSTDSLHTLAAEAYEVFAAAQAGDDVAPVINSLLAPARPTPRLDADGAIAWEVADRSDALRAAMGVTLLNWLHVQGAERLGLCEGIKCADAFADSSPAGRKKFCCVGCGNRHKVAEHRRRQAQREAVAAD